MYTLAEIIERLSQSMQDHEASIIEKSEFANLTVTQIHYLDAIRHFSTRPTISQIAQYMNVTKPTATTTLDRLERDEYIQKVPSPDDRRVSFVVLTAKGLRISDLHDQIHQGYAKNFENVLNDKELEQLVIMLNKVIAHVGL